MTRTILLFLAAVVVSGCNRPSAPAPAPAPDVASDSPIIEPQEFAMWPSVTEEPIFIASKPWTLCRRPSAEEERARRAEDDTNGPHSSYFVIVRVSPNAAQPFLNGDPLPLGAVVVKEKHKPDRVSNSFLFDAYALMIKREAGYDTENGDWEYAYVTIRPERSISRGRLTECSRCHSKASDRDYLFRVYLADE